MSTDRQEAMYNTLAEKLVEASRRDIDERIRSLLVSNVDHVNLIARDTQKRMEISSRFMGMGVKEMIDRQGNSIDLLKHLKGTADQTREYSDRMKRNIDNLIAFLKKASDQRSAEESVKDEMRSLQKQFKDVRFSKTQISVVVGPITLKCSSSNVTVPFGEFRIILKIPSMNFRINPLEPNPARIDSNTVHPHMQGDRLCTGEATAAINVATKDLRIGDIFSIIENTLKTYNKSSAYTRLEDWRGDVECNECGNRTVSNSESRCSGCGCFACEDCRKTCPKCNEMHCESCASKFEKCAKCDALSCANCHAKCEFCEKTYCSSGECLTSCNECMTRMCEDCALISDLCGNKICQKCTGGKECDKCGKIHCAGCSQCSEYNEEDHV